MSETIERLDYTKAPPGYRVGRKGFSLYAQDGEHVRIVTRIASSTAEALAAAWTHHRRERDPPGMRLHRESASPDDIWTVTAGRADDIPGQWIFEAEARAAAWTWHDRRLALSLRDEARLGFPIFTMAGYLALTDAQVEHAEANAIGHGPAPEPIDYAADLALLGEDPEVGALIEAHARDKAAQGRYADS